MVKKYIYLYHCPLLFIPILGEILYSLQFYLLERGLLRTIYISNKKQKLRDKIIKKFDKDIIVVCRSHRFGRLLKDLSAYLVFDETGVKTKSMKKSELYDLMWTLVFCEQITPRAKKSLNTFCPSDYPEFKI